MMMANPRRNSSYSSSSSNHQISIPADNNNLFQSQTQTTTTTYISSLKIFMKKPHACPFLLSIFLLLAWISLRFQHYTHFPSLSQSSSTSSSQHQQQQRWTSISRGGRAEDEEDRNANLIRFTSSSIAKDKRGWLLDPLSVAFDAGISGGVQSCASLHVGEIQPGSMRGNHRHHNCNETFLIWGAKTKFRLENNKMDKGYAEVIIGADEVGVIGSPSGTAHALLNLDPVRTTFFLGCQDAIINYSNSTDFNVWKDL